MPSSQSTTLRNLLRKMSRALPIRPLSDVQAATTRNTASAVLWARAWVGSLPSSRIEPSGLMTAQRQTPECSHSVRAKPNVSGRQANSSVAREKRQLSETRDASAAEGMHRKEHQMEITGEGMGMADNMRHSKPGSGAALWGVI
jgi:hypothetical protein